MGDGKTEPINRAKAHIEETIMSGKFTFKLVAAASLALALAPTFASAHGSGGHSGGFAPHASAAMITGGSKSAPVRFLGPPVRNGAHQHHFRRGFALAYVGPAYFDDGCLVTRRVMTPFGPRLRTINICGF